MVVGTLAVDIYPQCEAGSDFLKILLFARFQENSYVATKIK